MELLAGLIGVVVGFVSKAITDVLTERRRREGERRARLLEDKIKHGLAFMEASGRLARSRQGISTAHISLDGAKSSGNQDTYALYRRRLEEAQEKAATAFSQTMAAHAAIRLLMPTASEKTRGYLDLCNDADAYPDPKRKEREQAQQEAEAALRGAIGA